MQYLTNGGVTPKGTVYAGEQPAILDGELWERVQRQLEMHSRGMLGVRPPPAPGVPKLRTSLFLHAVLSTPVDRTGAWMAADCLAIPMWRLGAELSWAQAV